jgi:hypothetical protein
VLVLSLGLGMCVAGPARSLAAAEKGATERKPVAGLGQAEYQELKPILDVKNQPWASIPWRYSITDARKLGAATRKPIFMVVNSGNALCST